MVQGSPLPSPPSPYHQTSPPPPPRCWTEWLPFGRYITSAKIAGCCKLTPPPLMPPSSLPPWLYSFLSSQVTPNNKLFCVGHGCLSCHMPFAQWVWLSRLVDLYMYPNFPLTLNLPLALHSCHWTLRALIHKGIKCWSWSRYLQGSDTCS